MPSGYPLRYSIGSIDPRYGIEREWFLTLVRKAESTWEKPFGIALFEYNPTAEFSVSLVFDHRQQETFDAKEAKAGLDAQERSIRSLMQEYNFGSEKHAQRMRTSPVLRRSPTG
jgi:hypothetical protein